MKEIFFAGGCFWGTQHYLKQLRGVVDTCVGYANGNVENPTYEQVYTDTTGFVECVRVVYNPTVIGLEKLVELYFCSIDPTLLNRQGGDVGTRYRTGVYYTDTADATVIEPLFSKVAAQCDAPMVVELEPLKNFYPAEECHQDYLDKKPVGYCHIPVALIEFARKANGEQ